MSNLLLAIIGTLVSMLTMIGFSMIQLDKMSDDTAAENADAAREHEAL